jgi:NAD(P)-dependent dehydrogenase (short-subunit alcohol dehydrogenase family)
MSAVVVVIGAGSIGQAIARRVSAGKHVVLADLHQSNADAAYFYGELIPQKEQQS